MSALEPQVDVALLRKQIEHAHHHPEEWHQSLWLSQTPDLTAGIAARYNATPCGTVACIAGKTVLDAGWEPTWAKGGSGFFTGEIRRDGMTDNVQDVAQRELGLRYSEARRLFNGSNTLRDLYRIAGEITDGEIGIPDDVELPDGS